LLANQVPVPPCFSGSYNPAVSGPITSQTILQGETTQARPKVNENAARADVTARFGGGAYAIVHGLTLSAGAGLTLNIAAGQAQINGPVTYLGGTASLTNSTRNWIWISQGGAITVATSLTPPAGAQALVGSALTSGGSISSVDTSGVLLLHGGRLQRYTADTTTPTDTPPAQLSFEAYGAGTKLWIWSGTAYYEISTGSPSTPWAQVIIQPAAAAVTTTTAVQGATSNIELRSGGGVAAAFRLDVDVTGVSAGFVWQIRNTTGYPVAIRKNGGGGAGIDVYLHTGQQGTMYYDGSEIREVGRQTIRYGSLTFSGTQTYASPQEVEADTWLFTPSGGADVTVQWPASLALTGRVQHIGNDGSGGLNLTAKTNGADAKYDTFLLAGESQMVFMDGAANLRRACTRPYTHRLSITHDDSATYTVPFPDRLAFFIACGGTLTAARNLALPTANHKGWYVTNETAGGYAITVKTSGGTGVRIPNGKGAFVFGDGTNIRRWDTLASPTGGGSLEAQGTIIASTSVSNTASEGTLIGTTIGTVTLDANLLKIGRAARIVARGLLTTSGTPPTLNVKLKIGSVEVVTTGAQTPTASLTTRYWELDVILTCRTQGGSGTIFAQGRFLHMPAATTTAPALWEMNATATTTIDTTATQLVDVRAIWGSADAGCTITLASAWIELLN
jgi:hypothetical protein